MPTSEYKAEPLDEFCNLSLRFRQATAGSTVIRNDVNSIRDSRYNTNLLSPVFPFYKERQGNCK